MPNPARPLSLVAIAVATVLLLSACQRASTAGIPSAAPAVGPKSELVAIASSHARPNPKALLGSVRIVDTPTLDTFIDSYATGEDDTLSQDLRRQISAVPAGKVLVGGVISVGCDIPGGAVLSQQGDKIELRVDALPAVPIPECVVANMTVAIVAADFEDVPAGSTSLGRLTYFQPVTPSGTDDLFPFEITSSDSEFRSALDQLSLSEPTLAAVQIGDRRFAFLLAGCVNNGAELQVSATTIGATLTSADPPGALIACDSAEMYLTIIDVPADLIPADSKLAGKRTYRADNFQLLGTRSYDGPDALEVTDEPGLIQDTWGINPDLPDLDGQNRRFAFLLYGCQDDWAELTVTPTRISANLGNNRPANEQINCAAAEVYLATFDVPAAEIPASAELSEH